MANIYDIAKIKSRDPLGHASESAIEAGTLLEQFRHQEDIIDEINKAIKAAKKKAKEDKSLYGVGGSILGGLLGTALTGPLGALGPILGAGAVGGGAEKFRQKIKDPTKKLEKIRKKLKGRKQYEDVLTTEKTFEKGLDDMVLGDIISNALSAAIMPGVMEKGYTTTGAPSPLKVDYQRPLTEKAHSLLGEGAFKETKDVLKLFGMKSAAGDKFNVGQGGSILSALTGGLLDPSKMPQLGEALQNPWMVNLGRGLGPSAWQHLFKPKPMFPPYAQPQFRNPFGSTGGY